MKKPYSVLLRYPDGAQSGNETATYFQHVKAESPMRAVAMARSMAQAANERAYGGNEFEPLLVIEGHHEDVSWC